MSFKRWSQMRKVRTLKEKRDIEGLGHVLEQPWQLPETKIAALQALGEIADPMGAFPIVDRLCRGPQESEEWRDAAFEALRNMGQEGAKVVVSRMMRGISHEQDACAEALVRIGKDAVVPVMDALATVKDYQWWALWRLVAVLEQIRDPGTIEALLDQMQSRSGFMAASQALRSFPAEVLVGPLIERLRDGRLGLASLPGEPQAVPFDSVLSELSTSAFSSLLAVPQAVPPLIGVLEDPVVSTEAKIFAARLLATIGDPRAAAPLVALLRDSEESLLRTAQGALEKIGAPAVNALVAALKDPDLALRRRAAELLVKIPDESAVMPLIEVLENEDEDGQVRSSAATALGIIGDARAVRPLLRLLPREQPFPYPGLSIALTRIGKPAVPELVNELRRLRPRSAAWRNILWILRNIGDHSIVEPLTDLMTHEKSKSARWEIAEVLDEIDQRL